MSSGIGSVCRVFVCLLLFYCCVVEVDCKKENATDSDGEKTVPVKQTTREKLKKYAVAVAKFVMVAALIAAVFTCWTCISAMMIVYWFWRYFIKKNKKTKQPDETQAAAADNTSSNALTHETRIDIDKNMNALTDNYYEMRTRCGEEVSSDTDTDEYSNYSSYPRVTTQLSPSLQNLLKKPAI